MEHLEYAESQMKDFSDYERVDENVICFAIQNGPVKEVGANGLQITDVLQYVKDVYVSLNKEFPCRENALTITKLEEALHWQEARTRDREKRGVEGFSKP